MVSRRGFLAGGACLPVLPVSAWAQSAPVVLVAREARAQIAPDGFASTPVWSFDGVIPGPELRVAQGARLIRRVVNELPAPTAVHWHGIRIDNAMDGVPGLTQRAIAPGESFDYDFVVPDADTYWYHSHNRSMEQVERGLAGALIVEEAEAPEVDREVTLLLDDWRLNPDTVALAPFDNAHDLSHAGRLGNLITVNGVFNWTGDAGRNERLRLRLINAANARIFDLSVQGVTGWILAYDGMPLAVPEPLGARLVMAPGQRVDLIADVTAAPGGAVDLVSHQRDEAFAIARMEVGAPVSAARRDAPGALPPNPVAYPSRVADAPLTTIRMEGGAMRGLAQAQFNGAPLDGRSLAGQGKFWALSGVVDLTDLPLIDAARGEAHRIAFVNDTAFPHGMHMHGHHFFLLEDSGALGALRDTVLVAPGATQQVVFVADNPGDWLLHCHMLGHAQAGMKTWFRVA